MTKQELRKKIITKRKQLTPRERARADKIIIDRVMQLPEWRKAHVICVYTSMPSEVSTKALMQPDKHIVSPHDENSEHVDLYIVPGVAFDKKGNRLGRGLGWYDRFLTQVRAPKIGLAYEAQMVAEVPHTSYDIPMDMVVTQKKVYENKTP